MNKRLLALLLTIAMLLSLFPVQVSAEKTSHTETVQTEQSQQSQQTQQSTQTQQSAQTQHSTQPLDATYPLVLDYDRAVADLTYLTQTIGVRTAGTENELAAQDYVADQFDELGYEVVLQDVNTNKVNSRNVLGVKKAAVKTDLTIYVTAHIDTVSPSPGANDDGSGVVAMLAIARAFKEIETNYNIVFISFCAEEIGLVGSNYFVSKLTADEQANAIGNYNIDMVATGYDDCKYMVMMSASGETVNGVKSFDNHTTRMARAAAVSLGYGEEHFKTVSGTPADHYSFNNGGIPAVQFYWAKENTSFNPGFVEPYYHTADDNMTTNFSRERLELMVNAIALAVYNDATADYAAVVGEGTAREYYTTMEAALAAAGGDAEKVSTLHLHHGLSFDTEFTQSFVDTTGSTKYFTLSSTNYSAEGNVATTKSCYAQGVTPHVCLNGQSLSFQYLYAISGGIAHIYDHKGTGSITLDMIAMQPGEVHLAGGSILYTTNDAPLYNGGSGTFYLEGGSVAPANSSVMGTFGPNGCIDVVLEAGTITAPTGKSALYYDGNGTLTMSGGVELISDNNVADIALSGNNCQIQIASGFNPNEKTYTVAYSGTIPAEGLQITNGWSAAKAANGIDYIPFESFDKSYVVYEKGGELYIGYPPHTHDDMPGVAFETPISGEISGSFAPGAYYLTDDVKLTSNISLGSVGDVYICLNGFSISGSNGRKSINIDGDYKKLYICDCGETGHLELNEVNVKSAELHLLGGEIDVYDSGGMKVNAGNSKIVINGATVDFAATSSTAATAYVNGNTSTPEIVLLSGTIRSNIGLGAVAHIGGGILRMGGDIEFDGNVPDIFLGNYIDRLTPRLITIAEGFSPSAGRKYTVYVDPSRENVSSGSQYQLTSGWGEHASHLDYIPFVAKYQDHEIVELPVGNTKELFLIPCKDTKRYPDHVHAHDGVDFETLLDQDTAETMISSLGDINGIDLVEGAYILTEDINIAGIVLSDFSNTEPIEVNICLHGHDITMDGYASTWGPVNLNIYDCKGTGKVHSTAESDNAYFAQGSALWVYDSNSTINLYGGIISSNGDFGILAEGGITNIYGGTVTANIAVCVRRQDESWGENRGVGTLNISGDLVLNGTVADIYLDKDLVVNIVGNLTPTEGETYTVKVSDEALGELQATKDMIQITSGWGAMKEKPKEIPFVYHEGEYNIVPKTVDGVTELYLVPPHSHTVSTDCHPGTTEDPNAIFTTKLTQSTFTNTWTDGMNVVLMGDITASANVTVSGKVNLCLNGYTLDLGNYQIEVSENAELSVCDCNSSDSTTGGQLLANDPFEGVIRALSGSTLRIHGGTIIGDKTYGVHFNGSTMEMTGGVIRQMDDQQALRIKSGNVTITGGTISYEGTEKLQQAVFIEGGILTLNGADARIQAPNGGMGLTTNSNGKAILTKGTITASHIAVNNKTTVEINGPVNITSTNDRGIENNGTATISAGTITGQNYGIYHKGSGLNLSGDPVINGKTGGDIFLIYGKKVNIAEWLSPTDTYSVAVEKLPVEGEQLWITDNWPEEHFGETQWPFTSFAPGYQVKGDGNSDLYLVKLHNHAMSVGCETSGDKVIEFDKVLTAASFTGGLKPGNYVMTSDVTITGNSNFFTNEGVINICLNGHTLDLGGYYILFKANINICDCSSEQSGHIISSNSREKAIFVAAVNDMEKAKIAIYGGSITSNEGYIVWEASSGTTKVDLYGGTFLSKNTAFGRDCALTIHSDKVSITSTEGYGVYIYDDYQYNTNAGITLNAAPIINGALGDIKIASNKKVIIGGDIKRTDEETYRIVTETLPTAEKPNVQFTTNWNNYNGDPNIFTHDNLTYTIGTVAADPAHGITASSELHIKGHVHEVTDENGNKTFIVYDKVLDQQFIDDLTKNPSYNVECLSMPNGNYLLVEDIEYTYRGIVFDKGNNHLCLCGNNISLPYGTQHNTSLRVSGTGATLRIDDCNQELDKMGTVTVNWMGGIITGFVDGTMILANGKFDAIDNNSGAHGYGIMICTSDEFRMEGGYVTANAFGYCNYIRGDTGVATFSGGTLKASTYAIYLQTGKVFLKGSPDLQGGVADIHFETSSQYIHFEEGGTLELPEVAYTIDHVSAPSGTGRIQITKGWENSGLASTDTTAAKIPFVSVDGYAIREEIDPTTGMLELYLVIPEVTVKYDDTKGTASASPDRGVGAEIEVTAKPKEGYRVSAITWSYWDGTKTVTNSIDVSDAGEGDVTKTFSMPAADVTVTVVFKELHKHDGQTFAAITGNGDTLNITGILGGGGVFYLDGEGEFKLDGYAALNNELYLCLNGKTLHVHQVVPNANIYVYDCTGEGELLFGTGYDYWWNNGGTTTFKGVKITSLGDDVRGMFHSNPGKIVFDGCTVTDVNPTRTLNFANYGACYEVRNTSIINNGNGYAVDVEVPTFILDGYSEIKSAHKADIRLSYEHNNADNFSIIQIGEDFNPAPEGKPKLKYTVELYKVQQEIKEGVPLRITEGWSVAKAKNNIKEIPFEYYDLPGEADDKYEVFEMFGELWVGIPHVHMDRDGNEKKYYFHITKENIERYGLEWAEGTYFLMEDVVIPLPDPQSLTQLRMTGNNDICLNDHTLEYDNEFEVGKERADSITTTIDDCGDEGTAIFQSYRATNGTLILLGGKIIGFDSKGGSEAWGNGQVIVDGATLVSTATNMEDGFEDSKLCPTIYGFGGVITMVSGTIMKEGVDGNAVLIYQGSYEMEGDITLSCSGNYADIYFYNHIPIDITGPITPPEGETYTVEIREVLGRGEIYRITEGWTENSEYKEIPFVSTQGYIVFLHEDGELYLTPPIVNVHVNDETMGEGRANPDYGPGGYDYYGNVRTNVAITATPNEGYMIESMTMTYWDGTKTVTETMEYTANGTGGYTDSFVLPVANVDVYIVYKSLLVEGTLELYLWKGHELTLTDQTLLNAVMKCDPNHEFFAEGGSYSLAELTPMNYDSVNFTQTENGYILKGTKAGLSNGRIFVTYTDTATGKEQSCIVNIVSKVYEVNDSFYVLDYSSTAKLSPESFVNDVLPGTGFGKTAEQDGSPITALLDFEGLTTKAPVFGSDGLSMEIQPTDGVGTYGTFAIDKSGDFMTYMLNSFLNGKDEVYLLLRAYGKDTTPSTIGQMDPFRETEMFKKISVIPANVIYYEDNFTSLNYTTSVTMGTENEIKILGSGNGTTYQDPTTGNYGNDSSYLTPQSNGSGDVQHEITVNGFGTILSFNFVGTGFDLIGRSTADSGSLIIMVYKADGTPVYSRPLDTIFMEPGGAIYESALVHVTDLEHGSYRVEVMSVPIHDYSGAEPKIVPSYLYVDGVRIYNTLNVGNKDRNQYYADGEKDAKFVEIRNLVLKGQAAAAKLENGNLTLGSGTISYTQTVKTGTKKYSYTGQKVSSANDYLIAGPNNELYMNENNQAIVFYVKAQDTQKASMLQIGIRDLNDAAFDSRDGKTGETPILQFLAKEGEQSNVIFGGEKATVGYTEQYYTVDLSRCATEDIGGNIYYRVVLMARNDAALAMTNVKYSNLDFYTIPDQATTLIYDKNGNLAETSNPGAEEMPNLQQLAWQMQTAAGILPEDELESEATTLNFAAISLSLKSSIGMNYYVLAEDLKDLSDPCVEVTVDEVDSAGNRIDTHTYTVTDYEQSTTGGKDYLVFRMNEITAKEMNANIQATLSAKDAVGNTVTGETRIYNPRTYAVNMLNKANTPPALRTLLTDMLNYGAAAQIHFNYNNVTENLANYGIDQTYATKTDPTLNNYRDTGMNGATYPVLINAVSISLKDTVEMNFYVKVPEGIDMSKLVVKVFYRDIAGVEQNKDLTWAHGDTTDQQTQMKIAMDDLTASEMRTILKAWVVYDGVQYSNMITYSIESYAASQISKNDPLISEDMKTLLRAMMKYGDSTRNYFLSLEPTNS